MPTHASKPKTRLSYTYVDNSNVFIEGQRISAFKRGLARSLDDAMNRKIIDPTWRLNYWNLHDFVCGDRSTIGSAKLWGSPPPGDTFWTMVGRAGFQVTVYDKGYSGQEKKVDVGIAHQMTKDAYKHIDKENSDITLVSGDRDFTPVISDLISEGYSVYIAAWEHTVAKELRQLVESVSADRFLNLTPIHEYLGKAKE